MPLPRRRSSFVNLATGLALLAVTACGGGDGGGDPPTGVDNTVTQISLSQGATTLSVGGTTTYTAQPRNSAGTAVSGQTVTWTSNDPSVASVSGGVVTAVKAGTTNIVAAVGSVTATAVVTVTPPAPAAVNTVEVTPTVVNLRSGQTSPLTVVLKDASGATLTGRTVTWTSNSAAATVSATGVVTAVSPGTATITATSEGKAGTATVRVDDVAPSLASFTVTPAAVNVSTAAQTVTFSGRVTDAGSGVGLFYVKASSTTPVGPFAECTSGSPASGTVNDGTFTCTVTIPRGAANGDWQLLVILLDAAGNQRQIGPADLAAAGFANKITVTSPSPDQTPPSFTSLSVTPAAVDVRTGAKTVTATARLTDANSGVARFDFALVAPNGASSIACFAASPATGTVNDGEWSCTVTVPMGVASGDWAVAVRATDGATFFREYTPTTGNYPAGFPTKVTVTGQ